MREMLPLETALELLLEQVKVVEKEVLELLSAFQRVLAQEVFAPSNQPPFDRSPLDGYAVRGADIANASPQTPARLKVAETLPAGYLAKGRVEAGTAIRIMTGAPIPPGADTVIRFEDTRENNGWVEIFVSLAPGSNIVRAGEDIRQGELVLKPGVLLDAPEIGVLAALGIPRVEVFKRPRVAILSTGDELVGLDGELPPGKIRNSNLYALAASVLKAGGEPVLLGMVPDRVEEIALKISEGLRKADMLLTTGGASVGEYDMIQEAMSRAGARLLFWKIDMKPGTPVVAGEAEGKLILGLSGNPAAALISFEVLVRPLIRKMAGFTNLYRPRVAVKLLEDFRKKGRQRRFLRARVGLIEGQLWASLSGVQSPGVMKSFLAANSLLDIPGGRAPLLKGEEVEAILTGDLTELETILD
ncbi:molybdopterin molybdotransferase MoeA [Calderihabitans maritimus]|uniref:Molybdopterin molybdenumtransferase n=1 Tax=Calderihabitans maritimus TaxID=1246530 RepID=A0A1Z5HR73_9FIRM|nr:gephyrin-like molybdotransferase Glp [Calderihabitans maritimus]GAW92033.1 molybdopterin molybdenumtransferase [Calderihabitans maritimus]